MDNKSKKTQVKIFDFKEFQHIIAEVQQNYGQKQGISQQDVYHGFECMNHNGKQIEGICINEYCKALNRRACFDCINEKIHDKEQDQNQYYPPQNADELKEIINQYQQFLSNQIDSLEYQYYFQQLLLKNESNQKLACKNFQVLEDIGSQLENIKLSKNDIQLSNYIKIQSIENMGIFNYLQQAQQEIQMLQLNINKYTQKISQGNNKETLSQKYLQQLEMYQYTEYFEAIQKNEQKIILNIIETKQYKNKEIHEEDMILIEDFIRQILQHENMMFKRREYENFLQYSELYQKLNDQDPQVHFQIAFALQELNQSEEAIQMYDRVTQYQEAYYNKGISLYNLKRYDEAIQMCDRAIQLDPQYQEAYEIMGNCLKNLTRYDEAIDMYDRVIQLNPNYSAAYYNKGISLYNLKRYDEAIQMYDRAIQLDPQFQKAYNNKGSLLYDLRRYDEAIQMYDRVIQLNPQYSGAYYYKGRSLDNLQRFVEAIQMYERVIQLDPQCQEAYNDKGSSLYNLKRYDEAIQMYDRAIQLDPQFYEAYINKGCSTAHLRRYDEAIQMYDRAIYLNPQIQDAYNNKGSLLYHLRRYDEAIQMYDRVIQLNPLYSDAYNNKGKFFEMNRNFSFQFKKI